MIRVSRRARVVRAASLALVLVASPAPTRAGPEGVSPEERLPLSTAETAGEAIVEIRHDVVWRRSSGEVEWKRASLSAPGKFRADAIPGKYAPERETAILARVEVAGGSATVEFVRPSEGGWRSRVDLGLQSRDAIWKAPETRVEGLAVEATGAFDSSLAEGPLPTVARLKVGALELGSIAAGKFRVEGLKASGAWDRPRWRLDALTARAFGADLSLRGEGSWGTDGPPRVSIEAEARGLVLHDLLAGFGVPRADDIRAVADGSLRVEATGRQWERMDFDVRGREGTVYLSRRMIYDILAPAIGAALDKEEVEIVLDGAFGDATLIPFGEMRVRGKMGEDGLSMAIPLHNSALRFDIETRVDRPSLWDAWDYLLEAGIENVRDVDLEGTRVEREK